MGNRLDSVRFRGGGSWYLLSNSNHTRDCMTLRPTIIIIIIIIVIVTDTLT